METKRRGDLMRARNHRVVLFPVVALLTGLTVGLHGERAFGAASSVPTSDEVKNEKPASTGVPDFVTLAKRLRPTVVNISTIMREKEAERSGRPPEAGAGNSLRPSARSLGSGFVIGSDGTILTSYHVIANAAEIVVKLSDKRQLEAAVVGQDPETDIAIIKIDVENHLPTAPLGDSDRLQVGEWVMAVGNPFGLDNSVTSGIVSAKGRRIGASPYDSFIQTDASVNPGSSGGPLVNAQGEVVGINAAIVSGTGSNIGISFATPVNLVKEMLPQLKAGGKVARGWLGAAVEEVPPAMAKSSGLEGRRGALVTGVVKPGPAANAGMKVGDIITEFDGKEVEEVSDFPLMVARVPANTKVSVKVQRDRKAVSLSVVIAESTEDSLLRQR